MTERLSMTAFGLIAVAVVAIAIMAGCGSDDSDSASEGLAPELPTVSFTTDVTLTGSDTETCDLTFAIADEPANGTLSEISDQPCLPGSPNTDSAVVTFTADPDVCGPAKGAFTYTVDDGAAISDPATVTVDIPCLEIGAEGP